MSLLTFLSSQYDSKSYNILDNNCIFYMFFRFEIEIEPIFGTLALYDVKEKKKVVFLFM